MKIVLIEKGTLFQTSNFKFFIKKKEGEEKKELSRINTLKESFQNAMSTLF